MLERKAAALSLALVWAESYHVWSFYGLTSEYYLKTFDTSPVTPNYLQVIFHFFDLLKDLPDLFISAIVCVHMHDVFERLCMQSVCMQKRICYT
jgi:hypothetical protein